MSNITCSTCDNLVIIREEGAVYKECRFGANLKPGGKGCKWEDYFATKKVSYENDNNLERGK